jgi:hypothetical protein
MPPHMFGGKQTNRSLGDLGAESSGGRRRGRRRAQASGKTITEVMLSPWTSQSCGHIKAARAFRMFPSSLMVFPEASVSAIGRFHRRTSDCWNLQCSRIRSPGFIPCSRFSGVEGWRVFLASYDLWSTDHVHFNSHFS